GRHGSPVHARGRRAPGSGRDARTVPGVPPRPPRLPPPPHRPPPAPRPDRGIKRGMGDVPVVVGGWHLTLYARETLSHPEVDYAFTGDAHPGLPLLLDALADSRSVDGIPGLAHREGGTVHVPEPDRRDGTDFPKPARHLL